MNRNLNRRATLASKRSDKLARVNQQDGAKSPNSMKTSRFGLSISLTLLWLAAAPIAFAQDLQFAELGDFKLQSGAVIRDCRIGYRTFGKLAADKSNVIVFTTWASGTTEQAKSIIGPGKLMDSDKYYVVAIDALANGVSSSPSNSRQQPRMGFPRFTLRDTVNTQHKLLMKVLPLNLLKAAKSNS